MNRLSLRRLKSLHRKAIEGDQAKAERDVLLWQMNKREGVNQQALADELNEVGNGFGEQITRNNVQKIIAREDAVAAAFQTRGRT